MLQAGESMVTGGQACCWLKEKEKRIDAVGENRYTRYQRAGLVALIPSVHQFKVQNLTSRNKHRIAAVLALAIGLMTIVEGGSVLLGIETKSYVVLPWLLRYNVAMGFVSLAAGHGLWREKNWATVLATAILVCHGVVLLTLAAIRLFGGTVAVISIGAMLFRAVLWSGINWMIRGKQQNG